MDRHRMSFGKLLALATLLVTLSAGRSTMLFAEDSATYGAIRDFLVAHTKVVELTGEHGERVAICPEYQGRVMTSTTGDLQGRAWGGSTRASSSRGAPDVQFNNYGGEDRLWLGPEGGQYSLWFASPTDQKLANWTTPAALNDGAFQIVSGKDEPNYRLSRQIKLTNAAKTQLDLEVSREINLQKAHHFGKLFGSEAQAALAASKLKIVGFQTINRLTNKGQALTFEKGLVSLWSLGQFPSGSRTYVIIPYKGSDDKELGPIVNADYFSRVPPDRLRISSEAIWFLADGNFRSKIGIPQPRKVGGRFDRPAARRADAGPLQHAGRSHAVFVREQQLGSPERAVPRRRVQQL